MVKAPLHARIKHIPAASVKVVISGTTYYRYYGTYYRYVPESDIYIVEEPDVDRPVSDIVQLVDGSTTEGIYLGGTQSVIQLETDDGIEEIPIEQIISIDFAPMTEDEN